MTRRLYAVDPMTGTAHYVDYNEADDTFTLVEEVDVTQLIELNKAMFNEAPDRWGDGASAARLPAIVRLQLERDGILHDEKLFKRWLNDSDNRAFRIRPGRV